VDLFLFGNQGTEFGIYFFLFKIVTFVLGRITLIPKFLEIFENYIYPEPLHNTTNLNKTAKSLNLKYLKWNCSPVNMPMLAASDQYRPGTGN